MLANGNSLGQARYNTILDSVPVAYISSLRMNEYQLVITPHEDLRKRILHVKETFADKYDTQMAKYLKPHIPLVYFMSWSMMEEKMMQRLGNIAMGTTPFKVEMKDFGSFPSHSIFINVTTKQPIISLVKELKTAQRLMKADPEHQPHFMPDPNIVIARKLQPGQFEKGWLEYSHRHFSGKFIADNMLLLKRAVGEKAYQVAERFVFQNLPVTTRQASLFAA